MLSTPKKRKLSTEYPYHEDIVPSSQSPSPLYSKVIPKREEYSDKKLGLSAYVNVASPLAGRSKMSANSLLDLDKEGSMGPKEELDVPDPDKTLTNPAQSVLESPPVASPITHKQYMLNMAKLEDELYDVHMECRGLKVNVLAASSAQKLAEAQRDLANQKRNAAMNEKTRLNKENRDLKREVSFLHRGLREAGRDLI
ncbi:hypothetical protein BT96DRAFT_1007390 [Gymnopus androsaceus JB14]|uniref:Uncharacterized protein n=1 Tax=Gymnopus androsaceus JB14 TaxID=1447944 RepID=A0A6A4GHM3_9AGAR|nr:hypothetical protein BT96DRAFT_1007390 [Gymnopus androsaceus JB14]